MIKIFIFSLLFVNTSVFSSSNLFEKDDKTIKNQFIELNEIENMVTQQQLDFQTLQKKYPFQAKLLNGQTNLSTGDDYLAFMLGCCFGPVGVCMTIVIQDNNDNIKPSLMGCMVFSATIVGLVLTDASAWLFW